MRAAQGRRRGSGREAFVANFRGATSQWDLTSFAPEIQIHQDDNAIVYGKFSLPPSPRSSLT